MEGDNPLPEQLQPIAWLIGTWVSTNGSGKYPTIKDFGYNETIEVRRIGMQPLVQYTGRTSNPETGKPMHVETGFLRSRGNGQLSYMGSHNFGLTTLEEGAVSGKEIKLATKSIGRMTGCKDPEVLGIERVFTLIDENTMTQKVYMKTSKTDMTEHLLATYSRQLN